MFINELIFNWLLLSILLILYNDALFIDKTRDNQNFCIFFSVKEQCVVLFPYTALNEDELSLAEGQIVSILTKDVEDKVTFIK